MYKLRRDKDNVKNLKLNLLGFSLIVKQKFKAIIKCSFLIILKKMGIYMMGNSNLLIIQRPVKILPFTILISVAFKMTVISFFIPS